MTQSGPKVTAPSGVESGPVSAGGLETIVRAVRDAKAAPVELWNPPYCGDIGLEIHSDGSWYYQNTPIARRSLVELFASVLRKDDDGQTYLVTPVEKILVRVADAPFLAVEMDVSGVGEAQVLRFRTNLDTWVGVDAAHPLRLESQPATGGLKPYVRVRGRLDALVTRAIYLDLVALAQAGSVPPGEPVGVWSGGVWWPFA
jgi:hypothetical protein